MHASPAARETEVTVTAAFIELPQPKRTSLSESVADSIAEAIAMRLIVPGERIVEATLVEKLGVSRVPIREALKVLHAQGIISGVGHKGYRIAEFTQRDVQQLMEVRLGLEAFLLRDAIDIWRKGKGSPAVLDAVIGRMYASAKTDSLSSSLAADLDFHRTIRNVAENAIVGTLWDTIARHVLIVFNLERFRDGDLYAIPRQHEKLRDWIVAEVAKPETDLADVRRALEDHMFLVARRRS